MGSPASPLAPLRRGYGGVRGSPHADFLVDPLTHHAHVVAAPLDANRSRREIGQWMTVLVAYVVVRLLISKRWYWPMRSPG